MDELVVGEELSAGDSAACQENTHHRLNDRWCVVLLPGVIRYPLLDDNGVHPAEESKQENDLWDKLKEEVEPALVVN